MSQEYTEDKEVVLKHVSGGRRVYEALLILVALFAVYMMASLITFDPSDPSWSQTAWHEPIHNIGGGAGAWLADTLFFVFGVLAYALPPIMLVLCWVAYRKRDDNGYVDYFAIALRLVGMLALVVASCGLAALNVDDLYYFASGGVIGSLISSAALPLLGSIGATLAMLGAWAVGLSLFTGWSWLTIAEKIGATLLGALTFMSNRSRRDEAVEDEYDDDDERDDVDEAPLAAPSTGRVDPLLDDEAPDPLFTGLSARDEAQPDDPLLAPTAVKGLRPLDQVDDTPPEAVAQDNEVAGIAAAEPTLTHAPSGGTIDAPHTASPAAAATQSATTLASGAPPFVPAQPLVTPSAAAAQAATTQTSSVQPFVPAQPLATPTAATQVSGAQPFIPAQPLATPSAAVTRAPSSLASEASFSAVAAEDAPSSASESPYRFSASDAESDVSLAPMYPFNPSENPSDARPQASASAHPVGGRSPRRATSNRRWVTGRASRNRLRRVRTRLRRAICPISIRVCRRIYRCLGRPAATRIWRSARPPAPPSHRLSAPWMGGRR
ncbi:DNA translocase FtsK 4TM domain-containing protein [Edwardsiella tarda]